MSLISDNSLAGTIFLSYQNSGMENQKVTPFVRDTGNLNESSWQGQSTRSKTDTVSLSHKLKKPNSLSVIQVNNKIKNYCSSASGRAGEHSRFFNESTLALWNNDELQYAYHEFASSLSTEDLDSFLTAMEHNPDNLTQFMDIASGLSGEALSPFLESAALAGNDVDEFLASVDDLLSGDNGDSSAFQYAFMVAGVNAGTDIMDFVHQVAEMSDQTLDNLADFAETISDTSNGMNQNMDLFASVLGAADEKNLQRLIDLASGRSNMDKNHILTLAVNLTNNDLEEFIHQANRYASGTGSELSDYLEVASDAQARLGTFMDISARLDLSEITMFSSVDTVNFLDAAQRNPDSIKALTQTGLELSGTDRSNFLFAAANTVSSVDGLVENTQNLSGRALSDYLLKQANEGRNTIDDTIFMTAILTGDEYSDFKNTAKNLDREGLVTLMETTDSLSGQRRSQFLQASAASKDSASDFLSMFNSMSPATQADYLDTSSQLEGKNLDNFVQASVNAKGELNNFIQITGELIGEIKNFSIYSGENPEFTLESFLSLSQASDPGDFQGFISLLGKLDSDSDISDNDNNLKSLWGIGDINRGRSSFIEVAYGFGRDLGELNRLGNQALALGQDLFDNMFGMRNFSGNALSVTDYENLIQAAKNQDDAAWNAIRSSTLYGNPLGINELV